MTLKVNKISNVHKNFKPRQLLKKSKIKIIFLVSNFTLEELSYDTTHDSLR